MIKEKETLRERRKYPRLNMKSEFNLKISDEESTAALRIINISASGIYCQSSRPVSLFREIEVSLKLPGVLNIITCIGVVVRCEKVKGKEKYNLAIFFNDIPPKDKNTLSEYIEKKLARENQ